MSADQQSPDNEFSVSGDTAFWRGLNVRDTADICYVVAGRFGDTEIAANSTSGDWMILDEPLFWHRADRTAALINERFFSDLIVVDLSSLDTKITIGRVHAELLSEMTCERIIRFLLFSSILRTFVHSHSELQLTERIDGRFHRERYNASHFIYTSHEIRTDYSSEVEIDTQSGSISVGPCNNPTQDGIS